ncbi:MAG: phosphate signaling complex protein PhoU [bacterium]|nr:phosphate signaling complex protein PhoU [bacterium]
MTTQHIVRAYDHDLNKLNNKIIEMGECSLNNLKRSIQCMIDRDIQTAQKLIQEDPLIDQMERDVEAFAVRILALRQPVAQDLRRVVACLKVSADIERLGDYAANIARRVIAMKDIQKLPATNSLAAMLEKIDDMFTKALEAFSKADAKAAVIIWHQDEGVDEMYIDLLRNLLTYMMEDPRNIGPCTQLLFIAKHLERAGDHVTNICEMTYYMVHGEPFQPEIKIN